jgi:hypothetical protein
MQQQCLFYFKSTRNNYYHFITRSLIRNFHLTFAKIMLINPAIMKKTLRSIPGNILLAVIHLLACTAIANPASAQCLVTAAPVYSHSCSNEYFKDISISGAGVSSTVYMSGIGFCRGTYINDYALQGSTAPGGSTVTLNATRQDGYPAYLSVYIDWNNDGIYETIELAGTMASLTESTAVITYNFTVPATGADTDTNLHMRIMLSEDATGAPCTGTYGQTYDFFLIIGSGCTMPVLTVHPSAHDTVSNCPGSTGVAINASGVGMDGTFTWTPSAGLSTDTGGTVIANPLASTIYTLTGTSTGTCTATYLDTVTIISTGLPADTITVIGPSSSCLGDSIVLTGATGPGYTYTWYYNGIPEHHRSQNFLAMATGSYALVIDAYGCIDTSAAVILTFNSLPAPVVTFNGTTFYTANYYTSYQWYENGMPITGATADSVIATSDGAYNVQVTDTNGCTNTANPYSLSGLGVANIVNTGIAIYPNPANSMINILSPVTVKAVITGIEGEVIIEQNDARYMDISTLPAGLYFIALFDESGNRLAVQRLIKN